MDSNGELCKDHKVWDRSGNKDDDELNFYLTGLLYDCSFSISDSERSPKVFKCHKFVLARASAVFEKMLMGSFQESSKDRDDAIEIVSKVTPEAFDLAMRFLYGNKKEFGSCKLAVELYYFAHECMITSLAQAAAEFLRREQGPNDVLSIMNMYLALGVESELESCLKIVREETKAVFTSVNWKNVSEETMLTIYKLKRLKLSEIQLLQILLNWGHARVPAVAPEKCSAVELRKKINGCLMQVRLKAICPTLLTRFCASKSFLVLFSDREKSQILLSLFCNSSARKIHMPPNFAPEAYPRNLSKPVKLEFCNTAQMKTTKFDKSGPFELCFFIKKNWLFLEGVYLYSLSYANKGEPISLVCTLEKFCSEPILIGKISFDGISKENKDDFLAFDEPIALEMGSTFTIKIQYTFKENMPSTAIYNVPKVRYECGLHFPRYHKKRQLVDLIGLRIRRGEMNSGSFSQFKCLTR